MLAVRRRFEFERDAFAFPNELVWEYHFDEATGATAARRRVPAPDYALRCFVLIRAARQFLYHARFDPPAPPGPNDNPGLGVLRRGAPGAGVLFPALQPKGPGAPAPPHLRSVAPDLFAPRQSLLAWRRPQRLRDPPPLVPVSRRDRQKPRG